MQSDRTKAYQKKYREDHKNGITSKNKILKLHSEGYGYKSLSLESGLPMSVIIKIVKEDIK